jgi:predicted metal-dependent phosphoesterase TrpH
MIDLHAHTKASDGSFSPRELVALARERGLTALGITDHDTLFGWDEALAEGARLGVEIVPGVELSTSYPGGRFHILGYYIRATSHLSAELERLQVARANRNVEIFQNLRDLGVGVEEEAVLAYCGPNGQIGRPQIARAMLDAGHVASVQEAFDQYLADGKPGYATKAVLSPQDAIAYIHDAGGVAIWAHPPIGRKHSYEELTEKLEDMIGWGLDGLEIYYARYTPEDTAWTREMVQKYNLIGAGGSDFHGVSKPDITLGVVQDGLTVSEDVLNLIKARRDEIRSRETADEVRSNSAS